MKQQPQTSIKALEGFLIAFADTSDRSGIMERTRLFVREKKLALASNPAKKLDRLIFERISV
jgi:hypothetical protein